jgi:hypothetical protein
MKEVLRLVYTHAYNKSLDSSNKCINGISWRNVWFNVKEKVIIRTGIDIFDIIILKRFNLSQLEGAFENL